MKEKNNKSKLFKILLIALDVIAIAGLLVITRNWILNKQQKTVPEDNIETVQYKGFTLVVPDYLEYTDVADYTFTLNSDTYTAVVEFIVNQDDYIFKNTDDYLTDLKSIEYNLDTYTKEVINGKDVLVFRSNDESIDYYTLYCFNLNDDFAVNIELYTSESGESKKEIISSLMGIIVSSTYGNSADKYEYTVFYE